MEEDFRGNNSGQKSKGYTFNVDERGFYVHLTKCQGGKLIKDRIKLLV